MKGEAPRAVELHFTRHGPVSSPTTRKRAAFAVRTVWIEPGTSAYFGSSRIWRAKDWNELPRRHAPLGRAAARTRSTPTPRGDIGWSPPGCTPVAPNWDGLMPVPGDGRYEWEGFLDADDCLPVEQTRSAASRHRQRR